MQRGERGRGSRRSQCYVAALALLLSASAARAQSAAEMTGTARATAEANPSASGPGSPSEKTIWYGWQTLTTDAAALTLLLSGAVVNESNNGTAEAFAYASAATFVFGGPVVHAAHENWGRAFGSLGLRVGAPIVGAFIGAALEDCSGGDFCGLSGAAVGFTAGIGTAVALDAAVLARETVREGELAVIPVVSTGKNGSWVGLSGRF
jgi:hypothetical protein